MNGNRFFGRGERAALIDAAKVLWRRNLLYFDGKNYRWTRQLAKARELPDNAYSGRIAVPYNMALRGIGPDELHRISEGILMLTQLAYCYHCANYTQCGVYGRDERVLCEQCRPRCTECGLPRYEKTETTLCLDCEIKEVYDLAAKGELTQSETFEWIHELEEARREA